MSGIDDEMELHLFDTRKLVEEARKLRKAKDLIKQNQVIQKKLTAGISPLGMGSLSSNVPKGFFAGGPQTSKGAVTGANTNNQFKALQQHTKDLENQLKKIQKQQDDFQDKMIGSFNLARQVISNPSSIPNVILSKIGRFGIIGSLIAGSAGTIIEELSKQFQRGGVFSTALKVTKQAQTLNDVETENEYRSGTKYITNDLRIVQKSPQSSNTSNIKYETIRYTMESLGKT